MPCSCSRSTSSSQGNLRQASALGTVLDWRQGRATEWDGPSSLLGGGRVGCQPLERPRLHSARGPVKQVRLDGFWRVRPQFYSYLPGVHSVFTVHASCFIPLQATFVNLLGLQVLVMKLATLDAAIESPLGVISQ